MNKLLIFLVLVAAAFTAPLHTVSVSATNDSVCAGLSSGKIDWNGEDTSHTITATSGYVITQYCVKAGSVQQGNGPEYYSVDPGESSVTIQHSSGKGISHFSWLEEPVVVVTTTTTTSTSTTVPETTTTVPSTTTSTPITTTVPDTTVPETDAPTTTIVETTLPETTTTVPDVTTTDPGTTVPATSTSAPDATTTTVAGVVVFESTTTIVPPVSAPASTDAPVVPQVTPDELPETGGSTRIAITAGILLALGTILVTVRRKYA
jgi:LPXTG-motif cell wall-anchored protein